MMWVTHAVWLVYGQNRVVSCWPGLNVAVCRMPLNVVDGVRVVWRWRRGGAAAAVKVWRLTSVGAQAGA